MSLECEIKYSAFYNFIQTNTLEQKRTNTMGIKGRVDKMVVLACEDCKERNYTTIKNKKNNKERMELSKYCASCKKHTNHKETK